VLALFLLTRLGQSRYGVESETNQTAEPMQVPSGV
jgi:hypothetical protein